MLQAMIRELSHSSAHYANSELPAMVGAVHNGPAAPALVWNSTRDVGCLLSGAPSIDQSHLAHFTLPPPASTTETAAGLIQLYHELELEAFPLLNGWFSGLIVDLRQHRVILFNDRFGLGRLYLHEQAGQLFFASEAKSLLAIFPESREFDPQSLGEWLSCGCVLQNRSLFARVTL